MIAYHLVILHTEYQGIYAFVVLNKPMFVVSPNKPENVFKSLTPRARLFCQIGIMQQRHNADLSIAP